MTMYASKEINTDPRPWVLTNSSRPDRFDRQWNEFYAHAPRPEFDNDPNPILKRFREYVEERTDAAIYYSSALIDDALTAIKYHEGELVWERGADEGTDELFGALREFADSWPFAEHAAHIDHARRVLTRLALLCDEEVS